VDTSLKAGGVKTARAGRGFAGIRWFACFDWRHWARTIVAIRATPRQVALGMALGSFIAFTPFIGLQTLIAALIATIVGASKKAAMLAVWISNPVTMGPIFAMTYQLGLVLGSPEPAMAMAGGGVVQGFNGSGPEIPVDGLGFEKLFHAGWGYMLPMLLGGAVVGLFAGFIIYGLTHRGVVAYQVAHAKHQRTRIQSSTSV
jgi:uncharacterized protein